MNATIDILRSFKQYNIAITFGWLDVKQRYRRSSVGAFWLTLNMMVMIAAFALVFGTIFKAPLTEYLPFVTAGMIVWTFFNSALSEGCYTFTQSEGMIKQTELPLFLHILRMIWRNLIIVLHNLIVLPFVYIYTGKEVNAAILLAIPCFFLLIINTAWISLLFATICARFRDMPAIIANTIQVLFYLTPIIWMPQQLPERTSAEILKLNPLFHLVETVRAPLLGQAPTQENVIWAIGMSVCGWILTIIFYNKFSKRIVYWL
ncbi:ABC transporter permease [Hydrogenophaga bisanensis]|uniref:Transport permease protein n=1 Tax=Hydrogenophaga bisanensis TaxID=439611 RepID=A0ABW2R638_9BURK